MLDHQFDLDGYLFGLGCELSIKDDGFDNGAAEWVSQDTFAPVSGARMFGRDILHGPTWSFSGFTDGQDVSTALGILATATKAWRAHAIRDVPNAFQTLRYGLDGRTRRVYGRAKRFAAPPTNLILNGMVPVVSTFDTVDSLHYDDQETSISLTAISWTGTGGLLPPLSEPLTTEMDVGPREGSQIIRGDSPTPTIITFFGPSVNPWVTVNGWKIQLLANVALGQRITIDTRPWVNTVLTDGAGTSGSWAGRLSRTSLLSKAVLLPGPAFFTYGAIDGTGTSHVEVKWRTAWSSL